MKKKVIKRSNDEAYLIRYTLFNCRWFGIKVHHIIKSDDACLHDHPWKFISLILKGGYHEVLIMDPSIVAPDEQIASYVPYMPQTWYGPGSLLVRRAEMAHRLILPKGKTCWTLVITFHKTKIWGFFTKFGWVPWFKYSTQEKCD
jgi:hypothetical protein